MENEKSLEELTKILLKEATKVGLQVNESKTNFMNIKSRQEEHEDYLVVLSY